jgi:VIT1/CCC1 family predicted Fe2+/Mn2+ transporter
MKSFTHQTYEAHLAAEHKISPISTYLKEIVYGGIDGIITTFAVVAGFSGAQTGPEGTIPMFVVLLFGFANLFGDASSMGLGNFLSVRADQDVYRKEQKKSDMKLITIQNLKSQRQNIFSLKKDSQQNNPMNLQKSMQPTQSTGLNL